MYFRLFRDRMMTTAITATTTIGRKNASNISQKKLNPIQSRISIPTIDPVLLHGKSALYCFFNRCAYNHETPTVPTIATKNRKLTSPWMLFKMLNMRILLPFSFTCYCRDAPSKKDRKNLCVEASWYVYNSNTLYYIITWVWKKKAGRNVGWVERGSLKTSVGRQDPQFQKPVRRL